MVSKMGVSIDKLRTTQLIRAKTYQKDGKMVGELVHIQERSTEAAYVTKSDEVKTKAPKQSSRRIPLRSPRKWP